MNLIKLVFFLAILLPLSAYSQQIAYTEPESTDSRSMSFEIIGKVGGNYLVYKNTRNTNYICVYDNDMKLKEKVEAVYLPDKIINSDFVAYGSYAWMIYHYQKKGIIHCMAVKLDGNGQKMAEPQELDTTAIGAFSDNKIYNTAVSDDKQKIMVFKIQHKNDNFFFTTLLLNPSLQLLKKSRLVLPYEDRKHALSDFYLDNEGNLVFTEGVKVGSKDYIHGLSLLIKGAQSDSFSVQPIDLKKMYLDDVILKVDNVNKRYVLTSLYYPARRADVEGLFTAVWDKTSDKLLLINTASFSDNLKKEAKTDGGIRTAMNNFFINHIVLKKDGGFIITAEDFTTQSRTTPWNRMDYINPYYSSYDYYSSYRLRNYYNNYGYNNPTRYYYDNIAVLGLDNTGKIVWNTVIHKNQYDDETDNYLSFQLVNDGTELHVLFNELQRKNQVLSDQTIAPDGNVSRKPTLKSLDRGYEFMPKLAKQVSSKQIIVPCSYRNYICFAKIDFS
jgi:hypothetical protein